MADRLREMIDVAVFAEKELKDILGELTLQNEKLVDVQRKAGITQSHLVRTSRLIDDVFRATRPRLAIAVMVLFTTSVAILCFRHGFFQ